MRPPSTGAEFVLLTGPLGSGKTTLLSDYLKLPDTGDIGVIVNEAGAIDVDGAVLATSRSGLALASLPNGCICCTPGNDLAEAVGALMDARAATSASPLRRIVLETSGLAHPAPILRSLVAMAAHNFRLRIICTYDAPSGLLGAAEFTSAAAQMAAAQAVVATKIDLANQGNLARLDREVAQINPTAERIVLADRAARAAAAFARPGLPIGKRSFFQAEAVEAHPRVRTYLAQWSERPNWHDVSDWLDEVSATAGDRLLRIKGLIDVRDCPEPLLIESVGGLFSPPRKLMQPPSARRGLVLILRDMELDELHHARDAPEQAIPHLQETSAIGAVACDRVASE